VTIGANLDKKQWISLKQGLIEDKATPKIHINFTVKT
jgi:hypothetical protein